MQVVAEVDILDLADIQSLEANRSTRAQAVGAINLDRDHSAFLVGLFMTGEQAETRDSLLQRCLGFRRFKGDTAGHQALQRLAFDLNSASQPAGQRDAAGIPEPRGCVDQIFVFLLDMDADHQLLSFSRELVALHRADLYLLVENRATDLQRTEVFGEQHQVQARRT
ncbi:hypothetical protein D3C85_1080010 [compost metagenome]